MKTCQNGPAQFKESSLFADNDWSFLLKQTRRCARARIKRYCWRGEKRGLLPGGYDANSIPSEAIAEYLREERDNLVTGNGQLETPTRDLVEKELRRRVYQIIDRLRHRKENRLLRNEADLAPILTDDDDRIPFWEIIPAPDATSAEILMHKEDCAELEKFIRAFDASLGSKPLLKKLFACYCAGETKPQAMAATLNLPVAAIQPLQRRLRRKLTSFLREQHGSQVPSPLPGRMANRGCIPEAAQACPRLISDIPSGWTLSASHCSIEKKKFVSYISD